jgi:hypothetical protein
MPVLMREERRTDLRFSFEPQPADEVPVQLN